jgi:hypothetical protein
VTERSPKNIGASVHQRLKNEAGASGQIFNATPGYWSTESRARPGRLEVLSSESVMPACGGLLRLSSSELHDGSTAIFTSSS